MELTNLTDKFKCNEAHVAFYILLFSFWCNSPKVGHGLIIHEVSSSQTTTHHSR